MCTCHQGGPCACEWVKHEVVFLHLSLVRHQKCNVVREGDGAQVYSVRKLKVASKIALTALLLLFQRVADHALAFLGHNQVVNDVWILQIDLVLAGDLCEDLIDEFDFLWLGELEVGRDNIYLASQLSVV